MPRPKKVVTETKLEVAGEESEAKKNFRVFIEKYKAEHPAKYEINKAQLEKQLNQL